MKPGTGKYGQVKIIIRLLKYVRVRNIQPAARPPICSFIGLHGIIFKYHNVIQQSGCKRRPGDNVPQRIIIIGFGIKRSSLNELQQSGERLRIFPSHPERDCINEHAYHLFDASHLRVSPGDDIPEYDISRIMVTGKHNRPYRLQHRIQSRLVTQSQLLQSVGHTCRKWHLADHQTVSLLLRQIRQIPERQRGRFLESV
ncbi:hypothetical protein D3C87_1063630 [compost metagenome]